jgi:hypothetical protein
VTAGQKPSFEQNRGRAGSELKEAAQFRKRSVKNLRGHPVVQPVRTQLDLPVHLASLKLTFINPVEEG